MYDHMLEKIVISAICAMLSLPMKVDISGDLVGQTYGELFARLTLTQHLIPLGLYRR